jgi:membrane protein DedA with SNARE-associated domain
MYGLRNITPFALGMSQVGIKRFILLNALGAAIWALTYGAIGYTFGAAVERLLGDIKRYQLEVLATIVAVAVVVWLIRRLRQRRTEAAGPPPGAPPDPE